MHADMENPVLILAYIHTYLPAALLACLNPPPSLPLVYTYRAACRALMHTVRAACRIFLIHTYLPSHLYIFTYIRDIPSMIVTFHHCTDLLYPAHICISYSLHTQPSLIHIYLHTYIQIKGRH
jgi:hypothetical protein